MAGYSKAAVEAVACSKLGSRMAVSSEAGVEDEGVLKEGRWGQLCPGRSGHRDGGRLVFGNFANCWERVRKA
jgi:hypothetical protein